jgi:hypothetical protein
MMWVMIQCGGTEEGWMRSKRMLHDNASLVLSDRSLGALMWFAAEAS